MNIIELVRQEIAEVENKVQEHVCSYHDALTLIEGIVNMATAIASVDDDWDLYNQIIDLEWDATKCYRDKLGIRLYK